MNQLMPIFESLRQREDLPCSYPLAMGSSGLPSYYWVNKHWCHHYCNSVCCISNTLLHHGKRHELLPVFFVRVYFNLYVILWSFHWVQCSHQGWKGKRVKLITHINLLLKLVGGATSLLPCFYGALLNWFIEWFKLSFANFSLPCPLPHPWK
jgi:hypothetical protein